MSEYKSRLEGFKVQPGTEPHFSPESLPPEEKRIIELIRRHREEGKDPHEVFGTILAG